MTVSTLPALRTTQPLRDLQRINAAFSGLTGLALAAFSGSLSRQIDLPQTALAVLGIGLVGWSMMLVQLAVQPGPRLVRFSALVAAGDAAWVIGSVALIVLGDPTATGTSLTIGVATVVAAFSTMGVVLGAQARRDSVDDRTEILFRSVTVAAPRR